jgi:hypothetical protein
MSKAPGHPSIHERYGWGQPDWQVPRIDRSGCEFFFWDLPPFLLKLIALLFLLLQPEHEFLSNGIGNPVQS